VIPPPRSEAQQGAPQALDRCVHGFRDELAGL
jgi:hypothetical protein